MFSSLLQGKDLNHFLVVTSGLNVELKVVTFRIFGINLTSHSAVKFKVVLLAADDLECNLKKKNTGTKFFSRVKPKWIKAVMLCSPFKN